MRNVTAIETYCSDVCKCVVTSSIENVIDGKQTLISIFFVVNLAPHCPCLHSLDVLTNSRPQFSPILCDMSAPNPDFSCHLAHIQTGTLHYHCIKGTRIVFTITYNIFVYIFFISLNKRQHNIKLN